MYYEMLIKRLDSDSVALVLKNDASDYPEIYDPRKLSTTLIELTACMDQQSDFDFTDTDMETMRAAEFVMSMLSELLAATGKSELKVSLRRAPSVEQTATEVGEYRAD